jgi:hypothetical protein
MIWPVPTITYHVRLPDGRSLVVILNGYSYLLTLPPSSW